MVDPAALAAARRGYVIAAAGCGKTELIADAVATITEGRSLVLTHTHAGVSALRSRLAAKGVDRDMVRVETITGFALRYATAYPKTSGWDGDKPTGPEWAAVQEAAARVIDTSTGRQVLTASYCGVYVDEYQDCTAGQHDLVARLADALPTRVLGDPLQGIFGFAGETVDWDTVKASFGEVGTLSTPHRWNTTNPTLGEWLIDARERLLRGEEPDWSSSVIDVGSSKPAARQILACHRFRDVDSVVAIRKWPRDEQDVASRLGGTFTSMETIDSKDLFDAARRFDQAVGTDLALAPIALAASCMTKVNSHLRTARERLINGQLPTSRAGTATEGAINALCAVATDGIQHVCRALDAIVALPDVRIYRHELLEETKRPLRIRPAGSGRTLEDIAWQLRDDARRRGRRVPTRVVSRTLLVKGLEFDHALVLDANELTAKELYVAITRPRYSLTVLR